MSRNLEAVCPVCGSRRPAEGHSNYDCKQCGFQNAFISFFASEAGWRHWQEQAALAQAEWKNQSRKKLAAETSLFVGDTLIACYLNREKKVYILLPNGTVQVEEQAAGFDTTARNYAVLYQNGTVKVFGEDNEFGQKNTDSWKDIEYVTAAANCTYGITRDGDLVFAGSPSMPAVLKWKHVRKISFCTDYAVGLLKNEMVTAEGELPPYITGGSLSEWSGIVDIAASGNSLFALGEDGRVRFMGSLEEARREAENWRDILAIAADNAYLYGLRSDGRLLTAGSCKRILDKGRSKASEWEHMALISSNRAGIGGISEDGELFFAGTIAGDSKRLANQWKEQVKPWL